MKCTYSFLAIEKEGALFVGNHLSYLEIIALGAYKPFCFITSTDVKDSYFLYFLCKLGGCVIVEKNNWRQLPQEIEEVTDLLKRGINVILFPEGVSGKGEQLLKFHRAFFKTSVLAKKPVQCFVLNYTSVDNEKVSLKNRDKLYWYGDMEFFPHLLSVFKCKQVTVDVRFLDTLHDDSVSELSEKAYANIKDNFVTLSVRNKEEHT